MGHRIRQFIRWNAVAMVVRANHHYEGIGGHLATYASSATLYEGGFNHFFRGKDDGADGDQVFSQGHAPPGISAPGCSAGADGDQVVYQGHASPGIYARAFLEGRLKESQLDHFRRETKSGEGLSSYPHPRLMPDYWEFPTVSMGLGPITATPHDRFIRY